MVQDIDIEGPAFLIFISDGKRTSGCRSAKFDVIGLGGGVFSCLCRVTKVGSERHKPVSGISSLLFFL